jgi:type III pantothenate kinase
MSVSQSFPLIAVDVGNNRTKFGLFAADWFRAVPPRELPEPASTFYLAGASAEVESFRDWPPANGEGAAAWWIGSVNRPRATRLIDWLRTNRPEDSITLLAAGDLPLRVALERPDMVGIDRLLDALAANRLRHPGRPAVVVDVGTAITVDLVSPEGEFLGGSILPGISMSARALHEYTDMLPFLDLSELAGPPPALGSSTVAAMQSGLFWGAVGAIRQLIGELTENLSGEPEVFLTGGAGPAVAHLLGRWARHVPHLTLAGIALAAKPTIDPPP